MTQRGQSFTLREGNSATLNVEVLDDLGEPYDLTGCSLVWVMGLSGRAPVVRKTSDDPAEIAIPNHEGGFIRIYLTPADTKLPMLGSQEITYYHELMLTDLDRNVETVMTGMVKIQRRFI